MIYQTTNYTQSQNSISNNSLKLSNSKKNNITFGKVNPDKALKLNNFDKFMLKISKFKPLDKFLDWVSKNNKNSEIFTQGLMIAYSLLLQISYIINIQKDKTIPDERKEVLTITQGLSFIIPTIGALLIDNGINKAEKKFINYLKNINGKNLTTNAIEGIKLLKSVLIFAMMYKIGSTLISLPISNWISEKIHKNKDQGNKEIYKRA